MPNQSSAALDAKSQRANDREIFRLAVPAFFTLAAEPLFLLADSAIVGHLGTPDLAAVGIAGSVLSLTVGLCVFLAYGTTGAVAKYVGAQDLVAAHRLAVSALWLGAITGLGVLVIGLLGAESVIGLFPASGEVSRLSQTYLTIALFGLPGQLIALAATGVLRGLQNTVTPLVVAISANVLNVMLNLWFVYGLGWGLPGSAIGTALTQWVTAVALGGVVLRGVLHTGAAITPDWARIRATAGASAPLVVRSLALLSATTGTTYLVTTLAFGRTQEVNIAAHQVAMTMWFFLAYVLDAIAIAAQAITGRYLGAGDVSATHQVTKRMVTWGLRWGVLVGSLVALSSPWLPMLFTPDQAVRTLLSHVLLVMAVGLPLCGVVFVLDGILLGAGDNVFLAKAQVLALLAYLPLAALAVAGPPALVGDGDLRWLWAAFGIGWIAARCVLLVRRQRGHTWLALP